MGSPDRAGIEMPFGQFICHSNVLGREVTEDEQRRIVDTVAQTLARFFEKTSRQTNYEGPEGRKISGVTLAGTGAFEVRVEVLRSRGVRGEDVEAALPPGDFWGIKLFLREKPLQPSL